MPVSLEPAAIEILSDVLSDGLILFDGDDKVVLVNDAAASMLKVEASRMHGLSSDRVLSTAIGAGSDLMPRLRAGESVRVPSQPQGERRGTGFEVRLCHLPGGGGAEMPTALVLRDRRIPDRLRQVEDALDFSERGVADAAVRVRGGARIHDHYSILRRLSREVRRALRNDEAMSIILVEAPVHVDRDAMATILSGTLRSADRAGMLVSETIGGDAGPREVTVASLFVPLDDEHHWGLVLLPETANAGGHAVAMRMRAVAIGGGTLGIRFGVASLRRRADGWVGHREDGANQVLERAYQACLAEEIVTRATVAVAA